MAKATNPAYPHLRDGAVTFVEPSISWTMFADHEVARATGFATLGILYTGEHFARGSYTHDRMVGVYHN